MTLVCDYRVNVGTMLGDDAARVVTTQCKSYMS